MPFHSNSACRAGQRVTCLRSTKIFPNVSQVLSQSTNNRGNFSAAAAMTLLTLWPFPRGFCCFYFPLWGSQHQILIPLLLKGKVPWRKNEATQRQDSCKLVISPRCRSRFLAQGLPQHWGGSPAVGRVVTSDFPLKAVWSGHGLGMEGKDLAGIGVTQLSLAPWTKWTNQPLCQWSLRSHSVQGENELKLLLYRPPLISWI